MNSLRLLFVRKYQDEVEPRKRPRSQFRLEGVFCFIKIDLLRQILRNICKHEVEPRCTRPLGGIS